MFGRPTTPLPAVPGLQTQVSRRAMLGGLASLAVLFGTPSLAFADTPKSKASPFGTPKPTASRFRDANGNLVQPGPYSVQASCDLTEDYFLTADVLVGVDDQVVPFVNHLNGGAVEAVVVSQEAKTLSHVYSDPTTLSGWTIKPIPFPAAMGSVGPGQAAVAASPKGVYLGAVAPPDSAGQTLSWFTWLTDATTWATGATLGPGDPLDEFRAGVSPDQTPYFYGWVQGSTTIPNGKHTIPGTTFTYFAYVCVGQAAPQMRTIMELTFPASTAPNLPDAVIQYDVNGTGDAAHGVAAVLITQSGSNSISVFPQNEKGAFDTTQTLYRGESADALLWASTPAPQQWQVLYSLPNGNFQYADQGHQVALYGFGSSPDYGDSAVWVNDGACTINIVADGVVGVISQDGADAPFSLPVPLVDGVERIYSAATDPTQSTLFTVMADTTLSVLTKDPATGWTQHQVHQDTAEAQEVESYRAMISILDANGVGVAGAQAQITTDRLVGLWQEPRTNTIIEPGPYATVTADEKGKISVSIPAEELDCATLSVQALGPDGQPVGTKFVVTPHIDVASFFAGNTTLYGVGSTLNGSAMQNAGIFPNLNGASGATAAAAAVNHMATLGLNPQATDGDTQSAMFDMSTSTPSFESSSNPNAYTIDTDALDAKRTRDAARLAKHRHHGKHHPYPHPIGGVGGVSDWWNSVKHDADSAFHGLRHGAIKFKKMVTSWAGDVKQWTVNLIVDIGDGLDSLMSYVVDDIKSAIHAISSFFQALGADIKAGIDWVKNHVIDYLKDADANAKIMQGWFSAAIGTTAMPGPFYTMLNTVKSDTNGYLNNLAAEAHTAFQNLEEAVGDQSFGDAGPLPDMTTYTGAVLEKTVRDVTRIARFVQQSPAMWLLHKLEKHLPHGDPGPTPVATFQPVVDDLATDFQKVLTVADDIVTVLKDTAVDLFPSREGYSGAKITQWLTAVDKTVEDSIALLEAVIDTLLDLMKAAFDSMIDTLNYQIPVLGDGLIGWIFKKAGIDPTLSVGHLVALVASYPATLYSDVSGHGPLFPATPVSAQRGRGARRHRKSHQLGDGNDGWEIGLGMTAAVVQSIWGLNDVVVDVQIGTDEDGNTKKAPAISDWIDIFAPILLTILQWPSATDSNGNTMPPFYGGIDHSTKYDWMLPWIIISALCPPTMTLIAKRVPFGSGTNEPSPQNTKDPLADYYGPIIQMVSGIVNTAIGTAFSAKTSAGGSAIAGGVLGNLSYMLAVLAQKYVNEPAADGPMMVKMTVDFAGNIGAGVCIAESTSLPPK